MTLPDIDTLWDYQDPIGSERRFRGVLSRSGENAYTAELLSQIARAVCLQKRFEDAHAVLDEAEPLLTDDSVRARLRCRLERGRIHNDTGHTDKAMDHFEEAWTLAKRIEDHSLTADALHMIAYVAKGEESIRWHRVAIEFCRSQTGERMRRWLVTLLTNITDEYEAAGDWSNAFASVRESLILAEELGLDDRVRDARNFLARLHRLNGDLDRAMSILEDLVRTESSRGYVFEEYAECLLALGREEEATAAFRKAFDLLSKDPWYPPQEKERLERIRRLAGRVSRI